MILRCNESLPLISRWSLSLNQLFKLRSFFFILQFLLSPTFLATLGLLLLSLSLSLVPILSSAPIELGPSLVSRCPWLSLHLLIYAHHRSFSLAKSCSTFLAFLSLYFFLHLPLFLIFAFATLVFVLVIGRVCHDRIKFT